MKAPGSIEIVISAGIRGAEKHEIGSVEVPIRVARLKSMGSRDVQTILSVDTEDLQEQITDLVKAVALLAEDRPEKSPSVYMHKHHMSDVIAAAASEELVIVFVKSVAEQRTMLESFQRLVPDSGLAKLTKTNGAQEIRLTTGGSILFRSLKGLGGRGISADRVFVPIGTPSDVLMDLLPCVAASRIGLITGY